MCLLLLLPRVVEAQFGPVVEEVEPFSSSGSILAGSHLGMAGVATSFLLGHDYDYSLTGPLHLDAGAFLGFSHSLFSLRATPGLKYKFFLAGLPFVPYAKAGLLAELLMGEGARGQSLTVGLRLGGGVRHFFNTRMGLGAELGLSFGAAAGEQTERAFGLEALVAFEYLVP